MTLYKDGQALAKIEFKFLTTLIFNNLNWARFTIEKAKVSARNEVLWGFNRGL